MAAPLFRGPYAIIMVGRTAAGKTNLAKYLADKLNAEHILFAKYKRITENYIPADSLREDLRDIGYKVGIQKSLEALTLGKPVILDASFHKLKRRIWAYRALSGNCKLMIQIYCQTSDIFETWVRINSRKVKDNHAEYHASDFAIFEYINQNFDEPTSQELQAFSGERIQLVLDTFSREIVRFPSLSEDANVLPEIHQHIINYFADSNG